MEDTETISKMRDQDIRIYLRKQLEANHSNDKNTLILDELVVLQGAARLDIVVINNSLSGFEIKSDLDTFKRLGHQIKSYNSVMDKMSLVVGSKHLERAYNTVPDWWGITEARANGSGGIHLSIKRNPKFNPDINIDDLLLFLWKDEALEMVKSASTKKTFKGKTRNEALVFLAESIPANTLKKLVREQLKSRGDWRSGPSPFRCGDLRRSSARSRHSQANHQWLLSRRFQNQPN